MEPEIRHGETNSNLISTRVLTVSAGAPDAALIAEAARTLRDGRLVAFPTETVYGLGANALDANAVARIFEAKGRPSHNPLIVHVADLEAAKALAAEWPESAERAARTFWPGPLTLILPKRNVIPDIVTGGGPTVALRIPAHPVALALLRAAGVPIAAPSANRSTQVSPTTAAHVLRGLDGRIDMIVDGGPTTGGIELTVIGLAGRLPRLLRPGLVTPAQLQAILGPFEEATEDPSGSPLPSTALPSPGMMARHYAPNAPLEIAGDGPRRVQELIEAGETVGWLAFPNDISPATPAQLNRLHRIDMPSTPEGYAAELYAALHTLDLLGATRIVADKLPESPDWLALRDRLQRAATP